MRGTAEPGTIWMKMNSLVDPDIIDALYEASQAGVTGRTRGARHLLPSDPACPDFHENIRVKSIIGRFLERGRDLLLRHGSGTAPARKQLCISRRPT